MPTVSHRDSIPTTASVANVFLGSQYELAPFDATVEVGIVSTVNLVSCQVFAGPDILAEPGSPVHVVAAESMPIYPDHYPYEDEVASGDRLKVGLLNSNAGTAIVITAMRITPTH
jgi:hypothetical protein